MKVSTKLFNEQQIRQFSNLNSDIQKLQDKISTGKNILVASDDPVGSVDLSGYKTVKQQIDQYLRNIDNEILSNEIIDPVEYYEILSIPGIGPNNYKNFID